MQEMSWLAENLLASEEGLFCMESNCSHTALKSYEGRSENKVTRSMFRILCYQLTKHNLDLILLLSH